MASCSEDINERFSSVFKVTLGRRFKLHSEGHFNVLALTGIDEEHWDNYIITDIHANDSLCSVEKELANDPLIASQISSLIW